MIVNVVAALLIVMAGVAVIENSYAPQPPLRLRGLISRLCHWTVGLMLIEIARRMMWDG